MTYVLTFLILSSLIASSTFCYLALSRTDGSIRFYGMARLNFNYLLFRPWILTGLGRRYRKYSVIFLCAAFVFAAIAALLDRVS